MSAIVWRSLIYLPLTACLSHHNHPLVPIFPIISLGWGPIQLRHIDWFEIITLEDLFICVYSIQTVRNN